MNKNKEELEQAAREAYARAIGDETPEAGFMTAKEWSRIVGQPTSTVRDQMLALVSKGMAECREYRRAGRMRKFYRIAARQPEPAPEPGPKRQEDRRFEALMH